MPFTQRFVKPTDRRVWRLMPYFYFALGGGWMGLWALMRVAVLAPYFQQDARRATHALAKPQRATADAPLHSHAVVVFTMGSVAVDWLHPLLGEGRLSEAALTGFPAVAWHMFPDSSGRALDACLHHLLAGATAWYRVTGAPRRVRHTVARCALRRVRRTVACRADATCRALTPKAL